MVRHAVDVASTDPMIVYARSLDANDRALQKRFDEEVDAPLTAAEVVRGDVGVFADRHALALGNGKALVDNQIQAIDTMNQTGFLGWSHPPER